VVLTTEPAAAAPLPLPPRPLVLGSPTRASPLVQAVHTPEDLRVRRCCGGAEGAWVMCVCVCWGCAGWVRGMGVGGSDGIGMHGVQTISRHPPNCHPPQNPPPPPPPRHPHPHPQTHASDPIIGDREHILMLLANVTLAPAPPNGGAAAPPPPPIRVNSMMTWIGASPDQGRNSTAVVDEAHVYLGCGHAVGAVAVPGALGSDALRLQQMVLWQLPQVRRACGVSAGRDWGVRSRVQQKQSVWRHRC